MLEVELGSLLRCQIVLLLHLVHLELGYCHTSVILLRLVILRRCRDSALPCIITCLIRVFSGLSLKLLYKEHLESLPPELSEILNVTCGYIAGHHLIETLAQVGKPICFPCSEGHQFRHLMNPTISHILDLHQDRYYCFCVSSKVTCIDLGSMLMKDTN